MYAALEMLLRLSVYPGLGSILAALTCHHLTVNDAIEFLGVAKTAQLSTTEDSSMPDI
jgi:hypothetical protein